MDLKAFEEQLKGNVQPVASTEMSEMEQFEQMLKAGAGAPQPQQPGTIQVKKSIVLSHVSDTTGCGHIRNIFPMTFLNNLFGKSGEMLTITSPVFIHQTDILARCRSIFFQRQMTKEHYEILLQYKNAQPQLKYRMVWDMDDFIWGHNEEQGGTVDDGVPTYNFGAPNITDEVKEYSVKIMNLMDICTFSTQYLADYAKNVLKVTPPCVVVPNAVPSYFWGADEKKPITERIKKPHVLYTGSPTHYHNGRKMLGDFDNAWKDWVIKSVNEDKIEFTVMGGLPWFFEVIKDKINVIEWVDSFRYHMVVKSLNADFGIAPLVPNNFNHSKSDIKHIELCTQGVASIGTVFTNGKPSPYDNNEITLPDNCTIEDIDAVFNKYCEPEAYNQVVKNQYEMMKRDGRYLESPQYVNLLTSIF